MDRHLQALLLIYMDQGLSCWLVLMQDTRCSDRKRPNMQRKCPDVEAQKEERLEVAQWHLTPTVPSKPSLTKRSSDTHPRK